MFQYTLKAIAAFIILALAPLEFFGITKENIPEYRPEASYVIPYCVTRRLHDGALKPELLALLKATFAIRTFVETGTYLGDTTAVAAQLFEECHTIELSQEFSLKARMRFKNWGNIVVHQGNSADLLPRLLPNIQGRLLFYLDGHYSGGATAKSYGNTPIMQELEAIAAYGKPDSVILIDDIRIFQNSCKPEKVQGTCLEGYPNMEELVAALLKINPQYQICYLSDALLAFPPNPQACVSPVVRACAMHHLETLCPDLSEEELQEADKTIARAYGIEKEEIAAYYNIYAPFELEVGFRSFATLWWGLVLQEQGSKKDAHDLFMQTYQNSFHDWRIQKMVQELSL